MGYKCLAAQVLESSWKTSCWISILYKKPHAEILYELQHCSVEYQVLSTCKMNLYIPHAINYRQVHHVLVAVRCQEELNSLTSLKVLHYNLSTPRRSWRWGGSIWGNGASVLEASGKYGGTITVPPTTIIGGRSRNTFTYDWFQKWEEIIDEIIVISDFRFGNTVKIGTSDV